MAFNKLNINNLYIESLKNNDEILSVGVYFLLLTIEGYDFLVMEQLNNFTYSDNSNVKIKIKSILSKNNWNRIYEHLYSSIINEQGKKFLLSLKAEFKHSIEMSPYSQSRFSGRKAAMFKKTTLENANYIH
jgi:hypothetical protein